MLHWVTRVYHFVIDVNGTKPSETRLVILGTRGLPARYGGFETLAAQLSGRLDRQGLNVRVPSAQHRQSLSKNRTLLKYFENIIGTLLSAQKSVRHSSTAILVVNPVNVFIALMFWKMGRKVAIHMDGRDDMRPKWPIWVRVLYRCCQRLCVSSQLTLVFDSDAVRSQIGIPNSPRHVTIAYGGCENCEKNRKIWNINEESRHFVVVARAEPENQLLEVVRAFRFMTTRASLRVVSISRYPGRYWKRLLLEVGQTDSTELVEGVWDKELLCEMYREVSAVIHGHSVGGTNPSLVLALCHGTPVLAHDNPYNREVAGSMARYWKDEAELTKLLDEFDPMTWPYDQAAVDDFNRRYNWDDVVEKYRQLLGL